MDDDVYEVFVVKINQYLTYENIELNNLNLSEDNEHLFNVVDLPEVRLNKRYLIDDVSVNQLSLLVNLFK